MTDNRVAVKTTFDSAFGTLMALGIAGLSFAIYDKNIISGLFGILCVFMAIIINYMRNTWNENSRKQERVTWNLDGLELNTLTTTGTGEYIEIREPVSPKKVRNLKEK